MPEKKKIEKIPVVTEQAGTSISKHRDLKNKMVKNPKLRKQLEKNPTQVIREMNLDNVAANANASALINPNVTQDSGSDSDTAATVDSDSEGSGILANHGKWDTNVVLPDNYNVSALAKALDAEHLNSARQSALLKRALTDPSSLVSSERTHSKEMRVAEYTYKGIKFRVEAVIRGKEIVIRHAQVL